MGATGWGGWGGQEQCGGAEAAGLREDEAPTGSFSCASVKYFSKESAGPLNRHRWNVPVPTSPGGASCCSGLNAKDDAAANPRSSRHSSAAAAANCLLRTIAARPNPANRGLLLFSPGPAASSVRGPESLHRPPRGSGFLAGEMNTQVFSQPILFADVRDSDCMMEVLRSISLLEKVQVRVVFPMARSARIRRWG